MEGFQEEATVMVAPPSSPWSWPCSPQATLQNYL